MPKTSSKEKWWQTAFDEKYLKTYVDILTPERTLKQIDLLLNRLRPKKGSKILDLACGHGRHSLELAKRGYDVTGLDYSKHFIDAAKAEAIKVNSSAKFVRGDMRRLSFEKEFDVVLSLFTSFGYFENEDDHPLVLRKVAGALKPKGLFLMDLNNPISLLLSLWKKGKIDSDGKLREIEVEKLSTGLRLTTKHEFDPVRMRWSMTRSWQERGKNRSYQTDLRVFSLPELERLMLENGLRLQHVWGGLDGSRYGCDSRRIVLLAKRS